MENLTHARVEADHHEAHHDEAPSAMHAQQAPPSHATVHTAPSAMQKATTSLEIDADILASLLRQGLRILEAQEREKQDEAGRASELAPDPLLTVAALAIEKPKEEEEGGETKGEPDDNAAPSDARILGLNDLKGIAAHIQEGKVKNIVVMCGAGISVSAGTGLYSRLEKYRLHRPEDIFTISFFKKDPMPFHTLAREIFPGRFQPTPTHFFIKLLHDKGLLKRVYTQNIDSLESLLEMQRTRKA